MTGRVSRPKVVRCSSAPVTSLCPSVVRGARVRTEPIAAPRPRREVGVSAANTCEDTLGRPAVPAGEGVPASQQLAPGWSARQSAFAGGQSRDKAYRHSNVCFRFVIPSCARRPFWSRNTSSTLRTSCRLRGLPKPAVCGLAALVLPLLGVRRRLLRFPSDGIPTVTATLTLERSAFRTVAQNGTTLYTFRLQPFSTGLVSSAMPLLFARQPATTKSWGLARGAA